MQRKQRRILASTFTLVCVAITAMAVQYVSDHLGDESTLTGWTLLVSTLGLYSLSIRKKWILLPVGPVAGWLQLHAYMGTFASVVFLMHIGWPIRGLFESALAACFVIVAVTGIALGVLSRTTPKRLAALPEEYRLERIPALQATVAQEAHELALTSVQVGEGATLSEYYQRRLLPFFQSQRSLVYMLVPNGFRRRQLLRELNDLDRYLADGGRVCRQELVAMVCSKDDLDFHYAMQSRLRLFYAFHVMLTWALLLLIGVHVMLVYRFQDVF